MSRTTRLGWDVFTYGTHPRLTPFPWITGRVRRGDAYTVLYELCRRFNSEVESITKAHSWGWAYRPVRGASVVSEHAAGTAVDLNAPKHPLGRSGTFTRTQVNAINRILRDLDGAVRWGGNYRGRKDEMHFELQGGVKKLAAVARKIKGGSTTTKTSTASKPKSSSSGGGGSIVDYLNSKGQSSSFNARKKLAQQHGISNYRGTASQNTALLNKLKSTGSKSSSKSSSSKKSNSDPNRYTVRSEAAIRRITIRNTKGTSKNSTPHLIGLYQRDQVKPYTLKHDQIWGRATDQHYRWVGQLQKALNKWKGTKLAVDGSFGRRTRNRVIEWQKRNMGGRYKGTIADGVVGPLTTGPLKIRKYPN